MFFPVPFDEDDRDDSVWFLDHDYLENMYGMFKKVNGKDTADIHVNQLPSLDCDTFESVSSLVFSQRKNSRMVPHRTKVAQE